jgi:hypothetical protein
MSYMLPETANQRAVAAADWTGMVEPVTEPAVGSLLALLALLAQ